MPRPIVLTPAKCDALTRQVEALQECGDYDDVLKVNEQKALDKAVATAATIKARLVANSKAKAKPAKKAPAAKKTSVRRRRAA